MIRKKNEITSSDLPLAKRAAPIDPLDGAGRDGVTSGGPRLYHFRDTPPRILQLTKLFESLENLVAERRRKLGRAAIFGFVVFLVGCAAGGNGYLGLFVEPLVVLSLMFLLYAYNIRTLIVRRRSKKTVPGFGAGTSVLLFFGTFISLQFVVDMPLRWLRAGSTLAQTPFRTLGALLLSIIFVASVLALLNRRRMKKVSPQPFELFFVKTILERLLPEVAPNSRCSVAFNPFPENWSVWERKLGQRGRSAYFDTLLDLRLDLGADRMLALRFLHRRTQKGQRKFKGWKHKLKCKYVLTSTQPLQLSGATQDNILKKVREKTSQQVSPKINQHKFLETISKSANDVQCDSKSITLVQTFLVPCVQTSELGADHIPHPEQVLRTIKAICDAAEGRSE